MNDLKFLHALNLVYAVGPATLISLREIFGSYENAWHKTEEEVRLAGINEKIVKEIKIKKQFIDPDKEIKKLISSGMWILTDKDDNYPALLKTIAIPPPILYVRGKIQKLKNPVAVVGSRKATSYGIQATKKFTRELSRAGCEIISGLASGIDTAAHESALEEKGVTIAVLGSGIDTETIFPPSNRSLAERIIKNGGAIISEFPPGTPPLKHHFPQRNRIISGISRAILVTEAKERSGALITANLALEQNRDVFAMPGSIFSPYSSGPHNLLKEGAALALSGRQILDYLEINYTEPAEAENAFYNDKDEIGILKALDRPLTIDELVLKTGKGPAEISTAISLLELRGLVKKVGSSFILDMAKTAPQNKH